MIKEKANGKRSGGGKVQVKTDGGLAGEAREGMYRGGEKTSGWNGGEN